MNLFPMTISEAAVRGIDSAEHARPVGSFKSVSRASYLNHLTNDGDVVHPPARTVATSLRAYALDLAADQSTQNRAAISVRRYGFTMVPGRELPAGIQQQLNDIESRSEIYRQIALDVTVANFGNEQQRAGAIVDLAAKGVTAVEHRILRRLIRKIENEAIRTDAICGLAKHPPQSSASPAHTDLRTMLTALTSEHLRGKAIVGLASHLPQGDESAAHRDLVRSCVALRSNNHHYALVSLMGLLPPNCKVEAYLDILLHLRFWNCPPELMLDIATHRDNIAEPWTIQQQIQDYFYGTKGLAIVLGGPESWERSPDLA